MNLLPTKFISRHQAKLLFIIVLGHITILDLFYMTYSGPIFFWQETLQPFTIFVHLSIATLSIAFYFILIKITSRQRFNKAALESSFNLKANSGPNSEVHSKVNSKTKSEAKSNSNNSVAL